ncbi:hypothetical protein [Embleya sp. AB8]|uniref:hypothetical protein n=1 Tax=Embleya sp. AB8 TaxID=3156304 RepID=UPI003C72BEFC
MPGTIAKIHNRRPVRTRRFDERRQEGPIQRLVGEFVVADPIRYSVATTSQLPRA